jgi:hypothetical protein
MTRLEEAASLVAQVGLLRVVDLPSLWYVLEQPQHRQKSAEVVLMELGVLPKCVTCRKES